MRRAIRYVMLAGFVLALGVRFGGATVEAHNIVDQKLLNEPGCVPALMKGQASTAPTAPRQEVVPAGADIASVDLCLNVETAAVVTVNLYAGTIQSPGALLNSKEQPWPANGPDGAQVVHIQFDVTTQVTAGSPYIIEVTTVGPTPVKWRGTCGSAFVSPCTAVQDPDLYASGISNSTAVGDFWFRTYANQDDDLDGVTDTSDNCYGVPNSDQANSDSNITDLAPWGITAYDDATWPYSDTFGDACDNDDDNDGILDATEIAGPCGAPTLPLVRDTDGDLFIDGAECALGTNPNVFVHPPVPLAGQDDDNDGLPNTFETNVTGTLINNPDTDGDKVTDGREFKYFGTTPLVANTDSDVCPDGKEVNSVNADQAVTAIDLSQVAQRFNAKLVNGPPTPVYVPTFDITRDGQISALDLSQVAQNFGTCP